MKISKRSKYGLRALAELALYHKGGPISAKSISKSQDIPLQYLEQIFNKLKKKGLVRTARGPLGGYELSHEPSKIKVKDIINALEDNGLLVECLAKKNKASCRIIDSCSTRMFWEKLDKAIADVMDSTTLKDLCKNSNTNKDGRNNIKHRYLFQI